jgi:uncharacterized membrane protein
MLPLGSRACLVTRLMASIATATLALVVLFRSPADYRMVVCIIVSLAAITLVVRCLLAGNIFWAFPFVVILGAFTPFQLGRFSHPLMSIIDMVSLALFAASPVILRRFSLAVTPPGSF